jgi:hypothetical protein
VNADEWDQILKNETFGMPRYLSVVHWIEVRICGTAFASFVPVTHVFTLSLVSQRGPPSSRVLSAEACLQALLHQCRESRYLLAGIAPPVS